MICSLIWLGLISAPMASAQEGTAQEGTAQEGISQEGISQEGISQEGISQESSSQESIVQDAAAEASPAEAAPADSSPAEPIPAESAQAEAAPAEESHAAAEGEHSAGEGEHSEGYDPSQWWNFFLRILNFIVYVGILYFLLRKPVKNYFRGRREGIARQVEYLETQARNYEEQAKVMRKQLDELAGERAEAMKRYEADGAKERDRIIEEAKKAAEFIVQRTQTAMDQEIKAARRDLTIEAGRLAMSLAKDMLAKTVTSEDRIRLAHEFVEEVVKLPAKN